jgi:hypothetical protein
MYNLYLLSRIHNTTPTSTYFEIYNREYECLEYLFIIPIRTDCKHNNFWST